MKKILFIMLAIFISCAQSIASTLEGKYIEGMVGIKIGIENEALIVKNVISNSPAQKAGLKENDEIIQIDNMGIPQKDKDLNYYISLLKGKNGTKVAIKVRRKNEVKEFKITRGTIYISDYFEIAYKTYLYLKYFKYEDGKYYFWLKQLNPNSNNDFDYIKVFCTIDLKKNLFIITEQNIFYKNSDSITTKKERQEYAIIPGTWIQPLYQALSEIDKQLTEEQKSKLTGFIGLFDKK